MKYACPVCEWPYLRDDPMEGMHEICPQCGIQFGYWYTDGCSGPAYHEALRKRWIAEGRPWHSKARPKPEWLKRLHETGSEADGDLVL